jgi:hypothetical protein
VKSNKYNIDDVAIIDDEAGFEFHNGTIEDHKPGPGYNRDSGSEAELGDGDQG